LFDGSDYLAQVQSIQATLTLGRQDVNPVGDNWTRYKKLNNSGSGSFTLWKATSKFAKLFIDHINGNDLVTPSIRANTVPLIMLQIKLDDPEAIGTEIIQLEKVKLWEIPIGFTVAELVEESIQFTFEGIKMQQSMSQDASILV